MSMQVLIELQDAGGGRQRFSLTPGQYYMGKADTCAILLDDPHVSRHHATLEVSDTDVILTDNNSTNGTWFENQRILNPILVQPGDVLRLGTMSLTILEIDTGDGAAAGDSTESLAAGDASADLDSADPDNEPADDDDSAWDDSPYSERAKAAQQAQEMADMTDPLAYQSADESADPLAEYDAPDAAYASTEYDHVEAADPAEDDLTLTGDQERASLESDPEGAHVKYDPSLGHAPVASPAYYEASPATSSPKQTASALATEHPDAGLEEFWQSLTPEQQEQFMRQSNNASQSEQSMITGPAGGTLNKKDETAEQRAARERAEQMVQSTNPVLMADMDDPERAAFQQRVIATAQQMVARELARIDKEVRSRPATQPPEAPPAPAKTQINPDSVTFGALDPLMEDPTISRIMVNGLDGLFVERQGRLEPLKYVFDDQEALNKLLVNMLTPLGFDPGTLDPVMDTYLPDGTHLNIVLAPIATNGPLITLQKPQNLTFEAGHFLQYGSCSEEIVQFLRQCVAHNRNIMVTGAAGAGKSACLNMLTHFTHPRERVVVIEDVPELAASLPHAIRLQAGLARLHGVQGLNTQLLMNNTFSMRPDRIVLGEFFPNAALEMLMTMNNSSASFLTTFEAHSARDLMYRLELGIIMRKPELPIPVIRSQAAHAVNIIVTMAQFPDGSRKIAEVSEVFGIEEGRVGIQPVFRFLQGGLDEQGMVWGHYEATGYVPSFYRHKERVGEAMDKSIFNVD